jgi:hypothetical protein
VTDPVHLHLDDHPQALAVLGALFARRADRASEIGYQATEHGAWVDWDDLEASWLSSTEQAAVVVARGIALAEGQGGWAPALHRTLVAAVTRTNS